MEPSAEMPAIATQRHSHPEAPLPADAHGLADPADLDAWDYEVERSHAPFVLIHGCKSGI